MDREELTRRLMATFRPEVEEHLTTLSTGLLALEEGATDQLREQILAETFRAAHSLKGAARGVGVRDIESIAHALEDVLSAMKYATLLPSPEVVDRLLPALDMMREAMAAHLGGERLPADQLASLLASLAGTIDGSAPPEPASAPRSEKPAEEPAEEQRASPEPAPEASETPAASPATTALGDTIRVSTAKLDALMADTGELLAARMRSEKQLAELRELQQRLTRWSKSWRSVSGQLGSLRRADKGGRSRAISVRDVLPLIDFLALNEASLRTMAGGMSSLVALAASNLQGLTQLADTLQDDVRLLRMVPASSLVSRYPRMVRDLARERGKEVALRLEGGEIEIDRLVLETIADPLTHLLRNAADHGIESPARREASGKPRRGLVTVRIVQGGGTIVIEVSDDGAGIDSDAVRRCALARGLVTPESAGQLGELQARQLIFRSGVSTASAVTDLSGRGVGLDVVRENIDQLHGRIDVATTPGRGTIFTLTVPLTLATAHVLLAEVAGRIVAVPTTTVERILRVNPREAHSIDGQYALHLGGGPVALLSLAQTLGLPDSGSKTDNGSKRPTIALGSADRRRAFMVDSLLGTQEVVVKSLGWPLRRVRNVAGCCILGGGEVGIVLNVADLMEASPGELVTGAVAPEEQRADKRRILLVDDSITTRTLERNILENAGYLVVAAADGEEAWSLIRGERPGIVVTDVAMPRLDGVGLTRRIRADTALKDLPVVLVTSLASQEDRLRGLEAGADAYITKGTFDQHELLATLERLLG